MQTANIMLDIGGDNGNQVPKKGVTAAEIAVLIAIHGEAAVHDIEPAGDIVRRNRDELSRLREKYGRAKDGEDHSHVDILFPGAAARVFETIEELNLPEAFFKPTARAVFTQTSEPVAEVPVPATNEDEGIPPGDDPEADDVSDGVEDMPDTEEADSLFK